MASMTSRPYLSDLTEVQWALVEPMVAAEPGDRPARHPRRPVVEAILYLSRTGRAWRQLPQDFPPWQSVYWYFRRWTADGTVDRIHDALRAAVRGRAGWGPLASAGIPDAQSVTDADTVEKDSRGYEAARSYAAGG